MVTVYNTRICGFFFFEVEMCVDTSTVVLSYALFTHILFLLVVVLLDINRADRDECKKNCC